MVDLFILMKRALDEKKHNCNKMHLIFQFFYSMTSESCRCRFSYHGEIINEHTRTFVVRLKCYRIMAHTMDWLRVRVTYTQVGPIGQKAYMGQIHYSNTLYLCKLIIKNTLGINSWLMFILQTTPGKYVQIYGYPTFWYRQLLEVHASQKAARVSI